MVSRRNQTVMAAYLALLLVLSACAVRNNPNISPRTKVELNVAFQLEQAEADYKQFFIDVGRAKKAGVLTASQAQKLAVFGGAVKTSLEAANGRFKVYVTTKDAGILTSIQALLNSVLKDYALMYAERQKMFQGGQ